MFKKLTVREKIGNVVEELNGELSNLEKQSVGIFSTFHNMIAQLNQVNTEIQEKIDLTEDEISKMITIKNGLTETKIKNEKLNAKISEFVNV